MEKAGVARGISKKIRTAYKIRLEKGSVKFDGLDDNGFIDIPFDQITKIENDKIACSIYFRLGVLTLWKDVDEWHLTIYHHKTKDL